MSSSFRIPQVPLALESHPLALLNSLWQQKTIILAFSLILGLVTVFYAFYATPEYQVSSVLRTAAINELDALNRSEVYKLPPSEALIRVGAALESYETRLGFFRENQKLFQAFVRPGRTLEQSFEEFNRKSMNLILPDSRKADSLSSYIKLEMNYPKGVDGVAILNGFVEYAVKIERAQIAADMEVIVKNRLAELSGKMNAARASYEASKEAKIAILTESDILKRAVLLDELKALKSRLKSQRADRIALLDESILIAKTLGIFKPSTPSSLGEVGRQGAVSTIRTEINNQVIPLYFMGVEALEAERATLIRRKSDDFTDVRIAEIAKELQMLQSNREIEVLKGRANEDMFLNGVAPLRTEEARLRNLKLDINQIKLVSVDQLAIEPIYSVFPKKILIISMGFVLGLMLGVSVALARAMFSGNIPLSIERSALRSL